MKYILGQLYNSIIYHKQGKEFKNTQFNKLNILLFKLTHNPTHTEAKANVFTTEIKLKTGTRECS